MEVGVVLGEFVAAVDVVGIHADDGVGELGEVGFEFDLGAEREEEFGKAEDLVGIGGEFFVEAALRRMKAAAPL